MTVRTRFSPSPTGNIHLGNARSALFAALFAQNQNGKFILRIEDTDASRSEEQFVMSLQENLHWLGIDWQEGPGTESQYAPYFQSQRQSIYDKYYKILEEKKLSYRCFCTDQELVLARKLQLSRGLAPRYAGTCLKLTPEEIAEKIAAGQKPAWRLALTPNQKIEFEDAIKGPQVFMTNDISDFIIRRADGTAPFLFCNAIDDATMDVTHVLRGEDHLANTPRQIFILKLLNLPIPTYGHLSLIVGDDGAPLSKRHGSCSVQDMRQQGFLSQAIINYLGRLGHTMESNELLDFSQLAQHFRLDKLSRSPARFDMIQLMHWQKSAVQALREDDVWLWWGNDLKQKIPADKQQLFLETIKVNVALPQDAATWANVFFAPEFTINDEEKNIMLGSGKEYFDVALNALQSKVDLDFVLSELKSKLQINGKKLFMPLRIALTGKIHGPELAGIAKILGATEVTNRLERARQLFGN